MFHSDTWYFRPQEIENYVILNPGWSPPKKKKKKIKKKIKIKIKKQQQKRLQLNDWKTEFIIFIEMPTKQIHNAHIEVCITKR